MSFALLLRVTGASLVGLALLHGALWHLLRWDRESERLSPLNARVFAVHTFFVALVLLGLGLLSLARPELLLDRSDLARLLLAGVFVFWLVRLVLQVVVFDPVMQSGRPAWLRPAAVLGWTAYAGVYGAALWRQLGPEEVSIAPFDPASRLTWFRIGTALVWLTFGLVAKALDAVPRHRRIVARVVGEARARPVTSLVALAEIGLALWILSGRHLAFCAAVQTLFIASMNAFELRYARDLLLSPRGMLCANAAFVSLGWYLALAGP